MRLLHYQIRQRAFAQRARPKHASDTVIEARLATRKAPDGSFAACCSTAAGFVSCCSRLPFAELIAQLQSANPEANGRDGIEISFRIEASFRLAIRRPEGDQAASRPRREGSRAPSDGSAAVALGSIAATAARAVLFLRKLSIRRSSMHVATALLAVSLALPAFAQGSTTPLPDDRNAVEKTGDKIGDTADDAAHKGGKAAGDAADTAANKAGEAGRDTGRAVNRAGDKMGDAANDTKASAHRTKVKAQKKARRARRDAANTTGKAADDVGDAAHKAGDKAREGAQ